MKSVEIYSIRNQTAAFDGSCFCIHFIRDGAAWGRSGDRCHPLVRDGFLLQNIGTPHTIESGDDAVTTICLSRELVGDQVFAECLTPHDLDLNTSISNLLTNLKWSDQSDRHYQATQVVNAVVQARDFSRERFFLQPSNAASSPMAAAREFVISNLSKSPTVSETARHCGYSPFHFSRLFAEFHGMSLGAYILQEKIRRACRQLVLTEQRVAEIAKASGFLSPTSFAGTFKSQTRFSPTGFRTMAAKHRKDLQFFLS